MKGKARVIEADRSQVSWDLVDLDAWLPADHLARMIWAFTGTLDLSALYAAIKSVEGEAGRPAIDPRVLLALWLYATAKGVGSARELERLCGQELAYRWLAGGVPLNYHTLADFRVGQAAFLDKLLTESLTALMAAGALSLEEIIVGGTKVRAPASRKSYLRAGGLDKAHRAAKERVEALKAEVEADPAASSRRSRAAKERAARERLEKVEAARKALEKLKAEKEARKKTHAKDESGKKEPAASVTDPQARRMRFADGAVRAGYNAQVAVTPDHGFIVAIDMTDRRNDAGFARPMAEAVETRLGKTPSRLLADTNYATADDACPRPRTGIEALGGRAHKPIAVYAPPQPMREGAKPETTARRKAKLAKEPAAVQEWRRRMETPEAAGMMKKRKRIELVNAQTKGRGLDCLPVRGLVKAKAIALWHALTHNLMTAIRLGAVTLNGIAAA
jgi:transposase